MRLVKHQHPSYLSLMYALAMAVLLNPLLTNGSDPILKEDKTSDFFLYVQVFIVLLSSKAGIIGLIVLFSGLVVFVAFKQRTLMAKAFAVFAAMLFVLAVLLAINPPVPDRF